jgi:hypothetical protein
MLFRLQQVEEFNPPLLHPSTLTLVFNLQTLISSFGLFFFLDLIIKSLSHTLFQHILFFI